MGHRIAAQDVADPDRLDLQHLRRALLANLARRGRLERFAVLEGPSTGVPDAEFIPGTRTTPGKEHLAFVVMAGEHAQDDGHRQRSFPAALGDLGTFRVSEMVE